MLTLQEATVYESPLSQAPARADLLTMATRELAAFMRAVTESCGSETAKLAEEDWFAELAIRENVCDFTGKDWRLLTVAATARFAKRMVNPIRRCMGESLVENKLSAGTIVQ